MLSFELCGGSLLVSSGFLYFLIKEEMLWNKARTKSREDVVNEENCSQLAVANFTFEWLLKFSNSDMEAIKKFFFFWVDLSRWTRKCQDWWKCQIEFVDLKATIEGWIWLLGCRWECKQWWFDVEAQKHWMRRGKKLVKNRMESNWIIQWSNRFFGNEKVL